MLEMKTKIKAKSILISFRLASLNTNTLLYLNAKYQKYPKMLAKRNFPTFQSTSDNKPIFLFLPFRTTGSSTPAERSEDRVPPRG
jgi:hypothetical protein